MLLNSLPDQDSILKELEEIRQKESAIDDELHRYAMELVGQRSHSSKNIVHETVNLTHNVDKIVAFDPCFEAMIQDSHKLASQIGDCKGLSDRLSSIVRRLDTVQIRAQQALACTEDVINLKSCRQGIETALEERNIQAAVGFVKLVHDIDPEVARSSDDYAPVIQAERETKILVHEEFNKAVESSDIQMVISLCPTLQTLGLESEARDSFLDFVDRNVFIALSADACAVDGATEPATGYAQALSNIFNAAFTIIQQYLPVVIEGMENSNGDIYFIRKLHAVCTKESGVILKRYMKYRGMTDLLSSIKSGSSKGAPSIAAVHGTLDEFALLLQYCCSYSNYMHDLCRNAEKPRNKNKSGVNKASAVSQQRIVFDVGHENGFDKMVEELISVYYVECEKWLIRKGLQAVVLLQSQSKPASNGNAADSISGVQGAIGGDDSDGFIANGGFDEFFFVLQRCGMRAIGSSSIQASCSVLHAITDSLAGDVLRITNSRLNASVSKVTSVLSDVVSRWSRKDADAVNSSGTFSLGIKSAFSLASSLTSMPTGANKEESSGGLDSFLLTTRDALESFNICSVSIRYMDRLIKQIMTTASGAFSEIASSVEPRSQHSDVLSKILLCKDDFAAVQASFTKALLSAADQISKSYDSALRGLFTSLLGKQGPQGGVKWSLPNDSFDTQPAVPMLPKSILDPIEILISLCTFDAADSVKDNIIHLIVDATAQRLEQYVLQCTFSFAGALKFEECVRAIIGLFSRSSSAASVRVKFSRVRDIMSVLTADSRNSDGLADGLTSLTKDDINTFLDLRIDFTSAG